MLCSFSGLAVRTECSSVVPGTLQALEESRAAAGGAQAGVAVAFRMKPEGRDALTALAKGEKSWVSLSVNTDDETIEFVDGFADLAADQWPSKLPDDKPLYVFIKTGDSLSMVYYCPDTAPIKQKMLGSTVKASAQAQAAAREPRPVTASDRLSLTVRPT